MKILSLFLVPALFVQASFAQASQPRQALDVYYVAFLRPAPGVKPLAAADQQLLEMRHTDNLHHLYDSGILVAAGPMRDGPGSSTTAITDILVLKAASRGQAERIALLDPLVSEHRSTVDLHVWRGPKGIGDHPPPDDDDKLAPHAVCLYLKGAKGGSPEHEHWIEREHREGKLLAAGAVIDENVLAGICIFKTSSVDEAKALAETDPAVKAGHLHTEFHRWMSADGVLPW